MRKYLGSKITAYAAIVSPLFVFGPPLFGFSMLSAGISGPAVLLAIAGIACAILWGKYIMDIRNQLYSWGDFQSEGVEIRTAFSKSITMLYKKCKGCGIGFYTHGILNSKAGTRVYFIFLSYEAFDDSFRADINLWRPSQTRIKVEFNKKLYDYLLTVLPRAQALMLRLDYERYVKQKKTR